MAFDAKILLLNNVASIEPLLKAAYEQGVEDARKAIWAAAGSPLITGKQAPTSLIGGATVHVEEGERKTVRKARRGTVPKVLGRMMTEHPGKTIVEYEEMTPQYDDQISVKSVGNELRRMEGKRYRRNDDGEWFLMPGNKEAAGTATNETPAASDNVSQRTDR